MYPVENHVVSIQEDEHYRCDISRVPEVAGDPRRLEAITTDRITLPGSTQRVVDPGELLLTTDRVNQRFFSVDCLALTRLDKSPRGGAKEKRIKSVLHEHDDLICQVSGAHIICFVRWYFLVLGCCHLIQLLYSAEFNFPLVSEAHRRHTRSFGMRVGLVHSLKVAAGPTFFRG
jgi:hypothetical protein